MRPRHLCPIILSLLFLTACGDPTPAPEATPVLTPSPAPVDTLPPAVPTPTLSAPLQEGVDRFLSSQGLGDPATVKSLDFQQSIVPGEYVDDVYRLTYVPQEGAEEVIVYLLYYVGRGQDEPCYNDEYATEERVEQVGIDQAVLEASMRIPDIEFSFPHINFFGYFGLGGPEGVGFAEWLDPETVFLEDQDPRLPECAWYETRYDGLTLLCCQIEDEEAAIYKIETTRDDLWTYRGARVGMTKAEILDLYPEIDPGLDLWDWDNYLEYGDGKALGPVGSHIFFFFDSGDILTKITMEHVYID